MSRRRGSHPSGPRAAVVYGNASETVHPSVGAASVTQAEGSPAKELDTLRQLLFGAEVARLEEKLATDRSVSAALDDLSRRVTAQLDDLSRRQQQHADRVTQLLDQVMAQLGQRVETLVGETRTRLDEMQQRTSELERRKLSVADFGSTLATLGQRFAAEANQGGPGGG
jgi:DNA anti-recombination protein RmuC